MQRKKTPRMQAALNGEPVYQTGKPCIRGHFSMRDTVTGACKECRAADQKKQQQRIRDILREHRA